MPKTIDLRFEGFVALLVCRSVTQIAFEVAAEPVDHMLHEWASGARMVHRAKECCCEVREDADHDATVSESGKLGMIHDDLPTPMRQFKLRSSTCRQPLV